MVLIIILIFSLVVMTISSVFLGKELLKKFKIHERFMKREGYVQKIKYYWHGGKEPKMRSIVIEGEKYFSVLIGFKLVISLIGFEGTDFFGSIEAREVSDKNYRVVISTYMKYPTEFRFLLNSANPQKIIRIYQQEKDLEPDITCLPHWFQRF